MERELVCAQCGTAGIPKKRVPGYFIIEITLWFFFVIPGLIYTIWRLSNKQDICPVCKSSQMIPLDSPIGRKILSS